MNQPLMLTDPSGMSWLSKVFHSVGHFVQKYWKVIAAIAIAACAPYLAGYLVSTYSLTAVSAGIIAGAITGAAAGAIVGGAKGALIGAVSGGLLAGSAAAWGTVGNATGRAVGETLTNGAIGGGASEAAGGTFRQGFTFGAVLTAGDEIYKAYVNYRATWSTGDGVAEKDARTPPVEGKNNIGTQGNPLGKPGVFGEGGPVSNAANVIPGVNAVAGMHDEFMIHLSGLTRDLLNVPLMPVAAALTIPALLAETPGILAIGPQYIGCSGSRGGSRCGD
jgi:hypothetical protein